MIRQVPGFRKLISEENPITPLFSWPSGFIISWEKSNKSTIWAEDSEDPLLAMQF